MEGLRRLVALLDEIDDVPGAVSLRDIATAVQLALGIARRIGRVTRSA